MRSRPFFARFYAWLSPRLEEAGMARYRRRLLNGATGHVVEVGCGNGLNFAHYPDGVAEVVAVEPDAYLRARAEENAARAAVPIRVVEGVAEDLPLDDGSMDAAVVSLVLCSVPDQHAALADIRRVLRPGGRLLFLEHVMAEAPRLRRVQRVMDATLWPRLGGGCHTARDTEAAILGAGFEIKHLERISFPPTRVPSPSSPHIVGEAEVS